MFSNVVVVCLFLIVGLLMADKFNTLLGFFLCGLISFCITSSYLKKILRRALPPPDNNSPAGNNSPSGPVVLDISSVYAVFRSFHETFNAISQNFRPANRPETNGGLQDSSQKSVPDTEVSNEMKGSPLTASDLVNKNHCGPSPSIIREIKTSVHHISSEYIKSWYGKISDNQEFLNELDYVLEDILVAICNSISGINTKKLAERVLLLYLRHFSDYLKALKSVKKTLRKSSITECIGSRQELEYAFQMKHPSLTSEVEEWYYLKSVVGTVLDFLGPIELLKCPVLHNLVVEILAQNVLQPLLNLISDPSWINWALLRILAEEKLPYEPAWQKYGKISTNTEIKHLSSEKNEESSSDRIMDDSECIHKTSLVVNDIPFNVSRRHSVAGCSYTSDKLNPPTFTFSAYDLEDTDFEPDRLSATSQSDIDINSEENITSESSTLLYPERSSFWSASSLESENGKLGGFLLSLTKMKAHSNINLVNVEDSETLPIGDTVDKSDTETSGQKIKRSHSLDLLSQVSRLPNLLPFGNIGFNTKKNKPENKKTEQKIKSGSPTEVEEAEEAVEIDAHLFSNIVIVSTEEQIEAGRGSYTLYCIQYDALFTDTSTNDNVLHFVKQTCTVKRRFREFLTLQTRLDGNTNLKKHLKGIKGPSKWLATPFSQLDKKNVEERKIFLEHYLQELCNQKMVANSMELQEFLAYGGDPSIAYVKKATEITVPRIDKILVKGMKDAFDLLKTALPGLPPDNAANNGQENNGERNAHQKPTLPVFGGSRSEPKQDIDFIYDNNESTLIKQISAYLKNFDLNSSMDSADDQDFSSNQGDFQCNNYFSAGELSPVPSKESLSFDDTCEADESEHITNVENFSTERLQQLIDQEIPLASLVIDLGVESIQNSLHKYKYAHFVLVLKILSGSVLNRWLEEKIEELISPQNCVLYLHILHGLLWPTNISPLQDNSSTVENNEILKTRALSALMTFFTGTIKYLLGPAQMEASMELLLDSLQYPQLNRCLVYHMLDLCVESICSRQIF